MFKSFHHDCRGVAAVEFALILPALVALLFGTVGAFDLYRADRTISNAANTVVDLASRQEVMDDATRDALFATGRALMGNFATDASYGVAFASVVNDGTDIFVAWSESNANLADLTDADIPALNLPNIPANESVIVIRMENGYTPLFGMNLTYDRESSRRPRFVAKIAYDTGS